MGRAHLPKPWVLQPLQTTRSNNFDKCGGRSCPKPRLKHRSLQNGSGELLEAQRAPNTHLWLVLSHVDLLPSLFDEFQELLILHLRIFDGSLHFSFLSLDLHDALLRQGLKCS